jgi:hypothetical protein
MTNVITDGTTRASLLFCALVSEKFCVLLVYKGTYNALGTRQGM